MLFYYLFRWTNPQINKHLQVADKLILFLLMAILWKLVTELKKIADSFGRYWLSFLERWVFNSHYWSKFIQKKLRLLSKNTIAIRTFFSLLFELIQVIKVWIFNKILLILAYPLFVVEKLKASILAIFIYELFLEFNKL